MQCGVYIDPEGRVIAWTWADPTTICPVEFEARAGAVLVDLSQFDNSDAQEVIRLVHKASLPQARSALLAGFPRVTLSDVPVAPADHVTSIQPGYRRIVHRPTKDWHDKELLARLKANARIAKGEKEHDVIDEEFAHLNKEDKEVRKGMTNGEPFPLTPMVRLIERKVTLSDGSETVETIRQFPFHEPVATY